MLHWTEKGSIIRTGTVPSFFERAFPRGINDGSKSAGMYLLRTFRSPMVAKLSYSIENDFFFFWILALGMICTWLVYLVVVMPSKEICLFDDAAKPMEWEERIELL